MKFNVNNYIRVKLTDSGRRTLEANHNDLMSMMPKKARRPFELKEIDGWYRDQAWRIMSAFGSHIVMGHPVPFETEIEIEE